MITFYCSSLEKKISNLHTQRYVITMDAHWGYSRGARPLFFDKPALGCCKRLCMFILSNNTPGTLLGWTTLQIFYWMSGILTFVTLPRSQC